MIIIGIDPGLNGALAVLDDDGAVQVRDLPTIKKGKTGNKREIDFRNLYLLFEPLAYKSYNLIFALEKVHAMPGQGVTSMFSLGHTLGGIKAVIACLGYEMHLITPQSWKKYFGLGRDKEQSRALAIQLYPEMASSLSRKKDSDRAEALLIARYTKEVLVG